MTEERSRYAGVKGTVMIGAFDFEYQGHGLVVRGNYDYGYLKDAQLIGAWNSSSMNSTESPYKHTLVGQAAGRLRHFLCCEQAFRETEILCLRAVRVL